MLAMGKLLRNVWIHERKGKDGALCGGVYYGGNGKTVEVDRVDLDRGEALVRVQIDLARGGWSWVEATYLELQDGMTFEALATAA